MTKAKSDPKNCLRAGNCTCNCCNRARDQHCGSHNNNCHKSCSSG